MVSLSSSSQFLLLRESQACSLTRTSHSTRLCPRMTLHAARALSTVPLLKTPLNTHGLASAVQGRPLDARIEQEFQHVFHFGFLQHGSGCPSHPRYWTATDGLDPVAQIRLCRSAPSPTASSLHLVFSRVSAWGVPPFLDGKESTPATMAATDWAKSTGALATAAGGATELRVWPGLSGGQISSLNSILLA